MIQSWRGNETGAARLTDDVSRPGEVGGEHEHAGVGVAIDELAPRRGGPFRIRAEATRPLRLGDLDDPVHQIAAEHRVSRARRQADTDVSRRVAERRLESKPRIDRV